jgi:hypothetical protein
MCRPDVRRGPSPWKCAQPSADQPQCGTAFNVAARTMVFADGRAAIGTYCEYLAQVTPAAPRTPPRQHGPRRRQARCVVTLSPMPPSEPAVSWCALRHTSTSKSGHRLGYGMATRIYPYASAAVGAPQAPASGATRGPSRAGTGVQSFLVW